jgi:asparagine synthase (glutamine-hydrolysing)
MWASAIYDDNNDEIILTRDRFGIKPLYYTLIDSNLIFGSEIKFISSFIDKLYVNEQMVYEYLRFNYLDHTNQTLFRDILQVEPSHYMIYAKQKIDIVQYWDLKDEKNIQKEEIEDKLNDAIKLRMRSDVEVGSLLSGGIDSSTILGIINHKKYTNKFQTFSAVFREENFSEKKYIDKFEANNLKLKKHYIYPKPEELIDTIDELIYVQEEPFRSLAVFSQYVIYRYIKNNTNNTVLLNGQGADEIFTGYTEYYYIYLLELLRIFNIKQFIIEFKQFKLNRQISSVSLIKQLVTYFLSNYIRPNDKYSIFTKKFTKINKNKKFANLLKDSLYKNLTFSALREYLRYEDKNSMRFSLESRLPFLDFNLVKSAFRLKNHYKIKNGLSKVVLREIAKDKIPNETLNRKDKMGFTSPQEVWQKTILQDEFEKVFEDIKKNGIFIFLDEIQIYNIYQQYKNNQFSDWAFIWRLYSVYKWKTVWGIK